MRLLSSLRNRIFLASALVAVFSVASAIQFVTARVVGEAEADLRRGLQEAGSLLEQHHASRAQTLRLVARLIADLPTLKAAVETADPPTVQPVAADFRRRAQAEYLAVTGRAGQVLAVVDEAAHLGQPPDPGAVTGALSGGEPVTFRVGGGVLEMITVPVAMAPDTAEVLGTLSLGFALDDALATELKGVTQSEVAFVVNGRVVASTLPGLDPAAAARAASAVTPTPLWAADDEYVAVSRALGDPQTTGPSVPVALIMRSRTARLAFLRTFRTALLAAALVAVAVATVLSYAVARTVTRALAALTAGMREMAATGDLTRQLRLPTGWHDEDARLLAQTFNTLIDSIARFQREAAVKDRLTALGRLSTVIAHEVRNPLMIIKACLRTLRGERVPAEDVREAAADIDHEVVRLNRTVEDVLDFARPVRLELGPADLNAVCQEAVAAAMTGESAPSCRLELDPGLPALVTDAERLRTTLVNILSNAREAVQGRENGGEADVSVRTDALPGGGAAVTVADRGHGISPHDLAHIFEPYYTTKRTGTGLGLAIAKNIVDSLGGSLHARSQPGRGTEIRLELPPAAPGAGAGGA
jgi:signal transduction histidine kinase